MKKIKLFLMLALCFSVLKSQTLPSSCIANNILKSAYAWDINELAVRYLYKVKSKDTVYVTVPQSWLDTIMQPLAAIFNCTGLPERDSVFSIYCVHDHNSVSKNLYGNFLYVKIDTNYSWAKKWKMGNNVTGNPQMDAIIAKYKLTFINFLIGTAAQAVTLENINSKALCDSLETIPGVIYAELKPDTGDKNRISFSRTGADKFLDFRIGWGDCPSQCIYFHTWKFKILPNCNIQFLGHIDDPDPNREKMPVPVNCTISSVKENGTGMNYKIAIYPNPFTYQINFEIIGEDASSFSLIVYDALGRMVKKMDKIQSKKFTLDAQGMDNGFYLYELFTQEGNIIGKGKLMLR